MGRILPIMFFLLCISSAIVLLCYHRTSTYGYTSKMNTAGTRIRLKTRKTLPAHTSSPEKGDTIENSASSKDKKEGLPNFLDGNFSTSTSNSIETRGKWQQGRVTEFCRKYNLESTKLTVPHSGTRDAINLFRHLIYVDKKKLLFCFLPKVGCNHTKQLIFILAGVLSAKTLQVRDVPNGLLEKGIQRASFLNKLLSTGDKLKKLTTYWKFTIIRNPLERLLSAFLNKLSAPLDRSKMYSDYFENIKHHILQRYDAKRLLIWKANNSKRNLTVDFQTYIRWIVDSPNQLLDDHFQPMIHLAQPCRVQYNFFGNFRQISTDIGLVMEKFKVSKDVYKDWPRLGPTTSSLLTEFYSTVSAELKQALFQDFYVELDFYYHLFPEEKDSHVKLLGVKEVIL